MGNNLTGDFDVVAEFAYYAVDRILAAMHQTGRFLHSLSAHVDDNPHPSRPGWPVVVGGVDEFGDAIANQRLIGSPNPFPGPAAATNAIYSRLGVLVNPDRLVEASPEIVPSHISGVAQLQLFPPTVIIPQGGTNVTVGMDLMVRFFSDKGTAPLAEFMRGNLQITAPMNRIISSSMNVLDIDFRADDATISFTPSYTSTPLSPEDLAGINLCIQNGLRTSFLPSTVTLPNVADVQVKTLPDVFAIMLNLTQHPAAPSSATNVFLANTDDFAFAVGIDYLRAALQPTIDKIVGKTFSVAFQDTINYLLSSTTVHISYDVTPTAVTVNLNQQGQMIVLTIQGGAVQTSNKWYLPDTFSFSATVTFTIVPDGPTADLVLGNADFSSDSWRINAFSGSISGSVKSTVDSDLKNAGTYNNVRDMFDANKNFANSLNAQMYPPDETTQNHVPIVFPVYNSVEIQSGGIVLHGSIVLFEWPDPYVEFEPIPQKTSGDGGVTPPVFHGPDYSALKTWIPGGTIGKYEWSVQGQEQAYPFDVDPNRFVLLSSWGSVAADVAGTAVPGYSPLCLTITGSRISPYGSPVTYQNVTASVCGYTTFPLPPVTGIVAGGARAPILAITRPGPTGGVVVSGQVAAEIDNRGNAAPNLIVYFADSQSSAQLQQITEALARSNRKDAPTAVIAVLTPDQLSKAPYTPGIIYAEDQDGNWEKAFGVESAKRPLTLIIDPRGNIAWRCEDALEVALLQAALTRYLVKRVPVKLNTPRLNLRIGQLAPNFLFEYAPGREMPLSKFLGQRQPVILVFWISSVKTSIQTVRDLQTSAAKGKSQAPILLAVNDGDDPTVARAVAAENGITAILVTDPKREIGLSYGITLRPTVVCLDKNGVVSGIRYGYVPEEQPAR